MGNYTATTCDLAYSCWNETISCNGFGSCVSRSVLMDNGWDAKVEDASGTINVDLESIFECYGSYACMNSTYYDNYLSNETLMTISNVSDLYADSDDLPSIRETLYVEVQCFGFKSCVFMNMYSSLLQDLPMDISNKIDSSRKYVEVKVNCGGDQSCVNGTFINSTRINCYGERSCWNVQAQMAHTEHSEVLIYGHLAAQNATFIFNEGGTITFMGHLSGYGTKVICQNNETCQIICRSNACNHIQTRSEFNVIKLSN